MTLPNRNLPPPPATSRVVASKPLWQSKTVWGGVVAILTPLVLGWVTTGMPPDGTHVGEAIGGILALVGFRDQAGRIESYIAQVAQGAQGQ